MAVFQELIEELKESSQLISKQRAFIDMPGRTKPTPSYISVDELGDLEKELRESGFMVFRLGQPPQAGRGTEFALVKTLDDWNDYFFRDEILFKDAKLETFHVRDGDSTVDLFRLLPELTESSLVNLGLGSGLIQKALGIEKLSHSSVPATGRCNPSFSFLPNAAITETLEHNSGQVEIDALFLGEREGEKCLFLMEAKNSKNGKGLKSLAKHKLFYPLRAIEDLVPYRIIPVYLRTVRVDKAIDFYIAECALGKENQKNAALSELVAKSVSRTRILNI